MNNIWVENVFGSDSVRSTLCGTAIILGIGLGSVANASPISISSALDIVVKSGLDSFEAVDTASASQGSSINNLGTLNAVATSTSAGGTSITSGSALATWNNTAQGQVKFENLGWDNTAFSSAIVSKSSLAGTKWSYTFEADVSGQFSLNWDVSLHQPLADSFGLQYFWFNLAGSSGGQSFMGVDTTGSLTRNITAGNQYTATILTNDGIFGGVGGRNSFMSGVFDWSMDSGPASSVPESGPFGLMAMGLVVLGFSRRRIRKGTQGARAH